MWDILIVVLLVFLAGVTFGLGITIIMEFYYNKRWEKWKKEREDDE